MDIVQLIDAIKVPNADISIIEKLVVGFTITILSMLLIYAMLAVMALVISFANRDKKSTGENIVETKKELEPLKVQEDNSEELVSVITAAIAASLGSSTQNIVVRRIVRTNNTKSSWEI